MTIMSTTFTWLIITSEQEHNTCNTSAFEKVKILDHALKHAALLTSKKSIQSAAVVKTCPDVHFCSHALYS